MSEVSNTSLSLLSSKQIKFRNEHITYLSVIHDESTVEYIYLLSINCVGFESDDIRFKSIKKAEPLLTLPKVIPFYIKSLFLEFLIYQL